MNKKIKNASRTVIDNIEFDSALETRAYKVLKEAGLNFVYKPEPIILVDGWKCNIKRFIKNKWESGFKIRTWKYEPDFIINTDTSTIILEMKGFGNDLLPYKRKMLLKKLEELNNNYEYWEVYTITSLKQLINNLQ